MITSLNDEYFALGTLLNRLLNEHYDGKKIKFINIDFSSSETYKLHPILPQNAAYYYNGHLRFYGLINFGEFERLSESEQKNFLWENAYLYLQIAAKSTKNSELLKATEAAYHQGLKINLNPDHTTVVNEITLYGIELVASIWIRFKDDVMYSTLTLEKDNKILFEEELDRTKTGIGYFLEMYKAISVDNNSIIIKGRKDAGQFPLKIHIPIEKVSY